MKFWRRIVSVVSLLAPLALASSGSIAGDKHDHDHDHAHDNRQHEAHVHGIGQLNLVLDGAELYIELDSPAANIVGFEHAPSSDADHAALDEAVKTLADGERLFRLTPAAGCSLDDAKTASALLDDDHAHDDHGHADDKEHEHHDEDAEHAHDKEGGHGDHETHADIQATYHFTCKDPNALDGVVVELFEAFPGNERLKAQFVVGDRQGAVDLTPADHTIDF